MRSVCQALTSALNSRRVGQIKDRLDSCRNELVLRIIVSLKLDHKQSQAAQDRRFAAMDSGAKAIAERLLDDRSFFTTGISEVEAVVFCLLVVLFLSARKLHEGRVAAFATLVDWISDRELVSRSLLE